MSDKCPWTRNMPRWLRHCGW